MPTAPKTALTAKWLLREKRTHFYRLSGRHDGRFGDWVVKLRAIAKPVPDATGKLAYGYGELRCPRGAVYAFPLREPVSAESAPRLAARVAHTLDVG